ncbi:site-2 protease family protein [Actinocorallia libanotica]|uniref:site-2 protease family protein n=1 Tax=Actinocorallia libanotica TaxID=46162 RepID=UPI0031D9C705
MKAEAAEQRSGRGISPVFLAIVGFTAVCGWIAWGYGDAVGEQPARLAVFGFVVGAWIVSLCLHEFGHAFLAHRFGDRLIEARGYLTLNPLKYTDMTLSIVLPVLFLLLGGIGLPGGAVWVDRGAIRGRLRHSLISLAGPLANVVFALVIGLVLGGYVEPGHAVFWLALAYLGFLQVTAAVLNLLPVPGLDGFGIWEPYLPRPFVRKVAPWGGYLFLGLIALLWIPVFNRWFFDLVYRVTGWFGIDSELSRWGHELFLFWQI